MYITEFYNDKKTVDEAAMNPSSFSAAIAAGGDKKVVVGFEFEVCVPAATTKAVEKLRKEREAAEKAAKLAAVPPVDPISILRKLPRDWMEDLSVLPSGGGQTISQCFSLKEPVTYDGKTFSSLQTLARHWQIGLYQRGLAKIMSSPQMRISSQTQRALDRLVAGVRSPEQKLRLFQSYFYDKSRDHGDIAYIRFTLFRDLLYKCLSVNEFFKDVVGTTNTLKICSILNYNLPKIIDLWELDQEDDYDYDDSDDNYYDDDYAGAVIALKQPLEDNFGQVKVFSDYHQATKKPGIWYIEPDGSLYAKSGDASAEVVTPPLPIGEAMAALKTFYGIAKDLNLYTGADYHTGLHINVSIPETLDVLKLAVFLGDEYVLKSFNRVNNTYADSVMKSLMSQASDMHNYEKLVQRQNSTALFTKLQSLAKEISDDHTASISFNGKYVSFRHAGGDYLSNYTQVLNVVGRFVRGMIIASDPTLYRKEYLSKLTKLFVTPGRAELLSTPLSKLTQMRGQPVDAVVASICALSSRYTKDKILASYCRNNAVSSTNYFAIRDDNIIKKMITSAGSELRPETKQSITKNLINSCVLVRFDLSDQYDMANYKNIDVSSIRYNQAKIGVSMEQTIKLLPGSPLHTALLSRLILKFKKEMQAKHRGRQARRPPMNRRSGNVPDAYGF